MVGNLPHATQNDHVESIAKWEKKGPEGKSNAKPVQMKEEPAIDAEPLSSSDEFDSKVTTTQPIGAQPLSSSEDEDSTHTKEGPLNSEPRSQRTDNPRSTRRAPTSRRAKVYTPRLGSYSVQQEHKRKFSDGDKEESPPNKRAVTAGKSEDWNEPDPFLIKMQKAPKKPTQLFGRRPTTFSKSRTGGNADIPRSSFKGSKVKPQPSNKTKKRTSTDTSTKNSDGGKFSNLDQFDEGIADAINLEEEIKKDKKSRSQVIAGLAKFEDDDLVSNAPSGALSSHSYLDGVPSLSSQALSSRDFDPNASGSSTPLSSAESVEVLDLTDSFDTRVKCQFCREKVDVEFWIEFTNKRKTKSLKVRDQAKFCLAHKKRSAQQEYKRNEYPEIDWDTLTRRFRRFLPYLESVLENDTPSHFRNELKKQVDSGRDRTLHQAAGSGALQNMLTGYYGARGSRIMEEYLIRECGERLRSLASKDKIIAARDATGFVQAVLVPELAMKLIMEDMKVDEQRARQIMSESGQLGNVVNEDEDDVFRATQAFSQQGIVVEDGENEF